MKDKYYTPSIEEFYVGFEYYVKNIEGNYIKKIFNIDEHVGQLFLDVNYKRNFVKYLSKSDIESLGWRFTGGRLIRNSSDFFENDEYFLYYGYNKKRLIITDKQEYPHKPYNYFDGTIKNKSELIKLMSQLDIK